MKLRHIIAAPETLYIESVADNFYKAIFFQLNTYKLINHCQPRTWNHKKTFEFLKSVVSTLIKGCSDLDSALIKDLGNKYTTNLHVAFQQKIPDRATSRNSIYLCLFFIALFFKGTIQSATVDAHNTMYNYIRDWHDNIAAANINNNNSGNNDAGGSTKRKYRTEPTTRRNHLPIGKKLVARQEASSSKAFSTVALSSDVPSNAASSSKAPSSYSAPNVDIDNAAIHQAEKEFKETYGKFQASFTDMNLTKANLERSFSKYQGLVTNFKKKNYKPKPDIPLPDMTSATLNQYLAMQKELGDKLRHIGRLKGKSTDTLDNLTNQLRFAKIETDKLEKQLQSYNFAERDPFVLLTKETLSEVSPVTETPANVPSTPCPPVPGATSDSPAPGQKPQAKTDTPKPRPVPSQDAAPAKKYFKAEKETNEYQKYQPRHETTFEDIDFDQVKVPYDIAIPPEEFNRYHFPPSVYDLSLLNPETSTHAEADFATPLPPAQEQHVPKSSKNKGKQPMYPRA